MNTCRIHSLSYNAGLINEHVTLHSKKHSLAKRVTFSSEILFEKKLPYHFRLLRPASNAILRSNQTQAFQIFH